MTDHPDPDLDLVTAAQAGDARAANTLAKRYYPHIRAYFYRAIDDWHEAQDLTQKTLAGAIGKIHLFRKECSFRGWVYLIARRALFERGRASKLSKRGWRAELALCDCPRDSHQCIYERESVANFSDPIEAAEREQALRDIIDLVPQHFRDALALRLAGYSAREIAQGLDCGENTARSRNSRALAILRKHFGGDPDRAAIELGLMPPGD